MASVKFPILRSDRISIWCAQLTASSLTSWWRRTGCTIRRPCSNQSGRAKLLSVRLCACRLFRHLRQGVDSAHLDHRRRQMQLQSESDTVPASAPMEDYQHPFWQKARQKAHPKAHLRPPTGNFARPSNSHQPQIPPSKPRTAPTRPISAAPPTGTRQPQQSPHKTWNSHRAVPQHPKPSNNPWSHPSQRPTPLMDIPTRRPPISPPAQEPPTAQRGVARTAHSTGALDAQCQLCLRWGHSAVSCRSRESVCFSCGNIGHLSRACPA